MEEGLAIEIAPWGRAAGRPPSWTSPCPPWTSPRPLRHMEDAMRRNKLALCLYLVWTTDEQDASAPAQAGDQPQALQGRFQSLLLRDSAEYKTTSHHLCCFRGRARSPVRAHTPVRSFLHIVVPRATCNGRPTRNLQPATFIPSRLSPLASHQTVAGCKPCVAICFRLGMRRRATLTENAVVGAITSGMALQGGQTV